MPSRRFVGLATLPDIAQVFLQLPHRLLGNVPPVVGLIGVGGGIAHGSVAGNAALDEWCCLLYALSHIAGVHVWHSCIHENHVE